MTLTAEEQFRLNGELTREQIGELLDSAAALESAQSAGCYIEEARSQYPSEDFLETAMELVREIQAHVRGENADRIKRLMAELEERQSEIGRATEYGREQCEKALEKL